MKVAGEVVKVIGKRLPIAALAALLAFGCGREAGGGGPTSVIFVVIDTLRSDHLSLYGYEKPTSPGLERLAQEALVFERCLAPSSWTMPSTVSLLSGLYPARHGTHGNSGLRAEVEILSEILQKRGYSTGAFSGNPYVSPRFALDRGFGHFEFSGGEGVGDYEDAAQLLAGAEAWIEANASKPFFAYLHLMNVHGPYRAPPAERQRFLDGSGEAFPFLNPIWKDIVTFGRVERRGEVTAAHLRDLRARYDGAVAHVDALLEAFLLELSELGVLDRSLLVVTSDHGEELFEHGGFGHRRTLYGEVVDVPLLIRTPGGEAQGRNASAVSLVDLPATVLDWLGLLPETSAGKFGDGLSLAPLLRGEALSQEAQARPLVAQLDEPFYGNAFLLQYGRFRLLEIGRDYQGRRNTVELYDVDADPGERKNLAAKDAEATRRLRALARRSRDSLRGGPPDAEPVIVDEALARQLEALGYAH